jgi:hypothetical protein
VDFHTFLRLCLKILSCCQVNASEKQEKNNLVFVVLDKEQNKAFANLEEREGKRLCLLKIVACSEGLKNVFFWLTVSVLTNLEGKTFSSFCAEELRYFGIFTSSLKEKLFWKNPTSWFSVLICLFSCWKKKIVFCFEVTKEEGVKVLYQGYGKILICLFFFTLLFFS